jgi:site-specific DNA recombinase
MEIANSLIGQSSFTPDQLSGAIKNIQGQVDGLNDKIELLQHEIEREKDNYYDVKFTADELINWEEKFDNADSDLKKAMLSRILYRVTLSKDKIAVKFNVMIEELLSKMTVK